MESFSLLRYWRGGGGAGSFIIDNAGANLSTSTNEGTTDGSRVIVTAVSINEMETKCKLGNDGKGDDEGPFFDLEFDVQDEDEDEDGNGNGNGNGDGDGDGDGDDSKISNASENEDGDVEVQEEGEQDEDDESDVADGEAELNFMLSSGSSDDRTDRNLVMSPSDDLFFKGRLVPVEPSSLDSNGLGTESISTNPNQFSVSLLKSATKFRVFMLGLKKSKQSLTRRQQGEANGPVSVEASKRKDSKRNSMFTVKLKIEEVPIVSLFSKDNISCKSQKQGQIKEELVTDEKRFSKDVMQKYLKKVKPLYVRVSRKYGEKMRFSGQFSPASGLTPSGNKSTAEVQVAQTQTKNQRQGSIPSGLRVVCKHLGKSRSASSIVASTSTTAPATATATATTAAASSAQGFSNRRDDSLLQHEDGIQSAIMHCKRSFNSSRDSESSLLPRSASDPSHEKYMDLSRKSSDKR